MTLTKQDLTAIKSLMQGEITASEQRMGDKIDASITASEQRMGDKIDSSVTASEQRMGKKIDASIAASEQRMTTRIDELLDAIHDVGIEVTETKSILVQHIGNSKIWKH